MRYAILFALLVGFGSIDTAAAQGRSDREDGRRPTVITDDDDRRDKGRADSRVEKGRREEMGRARSESRRDSRTTDGRESRRDDDRRDGAWGILGGPSGEQGKNGKGPKFCREGNGHPVHGRQWCVDKGFGLGNRDFGLWEQRRADGIFLPSPQRNTDTVNRGVLGDILGDVILGRLNNQARDMNADGPLVGRMNGASELRIFAGSTPLARLIDENGDRRADVVYFRR